MRSIANLVLGMCVLTAAAPSSRPAELVFGANEVSAMQGSSPCKGKKISGKVPVLPRMKCRIS